jgi:hypothetical protein
MKLGRSMEHIGIVVCTATKVQKKAKYIMALWCHVIIDIFRKDSRPYRSIRRRAEWTGL